jgi:hypothetical protein
MKALKRQHIPGLPDNITFPDYLQSRKWGNRGGGYVHICITPIAKTIDSAMVFNIDHSRYPPYIAVYMSFAHSYKFSMTHFQKSKFLSTFQRFNVMKNVYCDVYGGIARRVCPRFGPALKGRAK